MHMPRFLYFIVIIPLVTTEIDFPDILVVLNCQRISLDKCKTQENILAQKPYKSIFIVPRDISNEGAWTVLPIMPWIDTHCGNCKWIVFATEETVIHSENLKQLLNYGDSQFLGFALSDAEPTIIHHFSTNLDLTYPRFQTGFLLSKELVSRISNYLRKNDGNSQMDNFSIDASYELALFLFKNFKLILTHSDKFCINFSKKCATSIASRESPIETKLSEIFFSIKTCEKFHKDRVAVVKKTWGNLVENVIFFSDNSEKSIPTIKLNITNTPHGHCSKTRAILEYMRNIFLSRTDLLWCVISDDDTIFGISQIQKILSDFDFKQPIALGERYGYNLRYETGYNYLTGGSGIILSRSAILKFQNDTCVCPSPSTPDDMFLFGICLKRLNIELVHSPLFHQARPSDYSSDYLSIGHPVSFHKHWMIDPFDVYKTWFSEDRDIHNEL